MSVNTSSSSKYSNSINSNYDVNTPTGEHFAIKNQKKFNVSDDLSTSAARKDKINYKKSGNAVETMDLSGDNAGIVHIKKGDTGTISSSALDLSKITDNHYDAANGKFIDEKYILKDYWTGDFEYRIEDDGVVYLSKNGVPMGRTHLDFIKINTNAVDDSVSKPIKDVPNTKSNDSYRSINTRTNTSGYMNTNAVPNTNSNSSYHSINTRTNTSGYMNTDIINNKNLGSNYSSVNLNNNNFGFFNNNLERNNNLNLNVGGINL